MLATIATGTLTADPQMRMSARGTPFFTARLRVSTGQDETLWLDVVTFSETCGARLAALRAGDTAAVGGMLTQSRWTGQDGVERTGWRLTATSVMSPAEHRARRERVAQAYQDSAQGEDGDPAAAGRARGQDARSPAELDGDIFL